MESRLIECLNEIMYAEDCSSSLRQILDNVKELDDLVSAYDASGFDEFIQSEEFADFVFEHFGVAL